MSLKMRINLFFLLCTFHTIFKGEGLNSSLLDGKVINGFPVVQRDVKFMASLKMNLIHFCGGCVISTKHILTAGQCIYLIKLQGVMDFANIIVWLGTIHLFGYGITRNVKDLEHHPQFDPLAPRETCAFDIGVILLDKEIVETNIIDKITYPKVNLVHNMKTIIIGWEPQAILYANNPPYPMNKLSVLRKIYVKIVGSKICQIAYAKLKYDRDRHFCAEGQGESTTSQGGVGNPLVKDNKLLGITIQTPILGLGRQASLFIKVSKFSVYIEEAKFRLVENQNSHGNKRSNEQCPESNIKRKKTDSVN